MYLTPAEPSFLFYSIILTNIKMRCVLLILLYCVRAWRSGAERRFYDDHDRKVHGSIPNLVSLLRPWIRCLSMIIFAWWNLASSKLKKSEAKFNRKNLETKITPKRV